MGANNNICYPRAIEALHSSANSIAKSIESIELKENYINHNKRKYDKNITIPMYADGYEKHNLQKVKKKSLSDDYDPLKEFQTDEALLTEHIHDDVFYVPKKHKQSTERRNSITLKYRRRTDSEGSYRSLRSRRGTWSKSESGVRPLYRDDIFFHASLHRLPQYKSYVSNITSKILSVNSPLV